MKPGNVGCDDHEPRHERCLGGCACGRTALGFPVLALALSLAYSSDGRAQDASELQAQIERQRAENQALKTRIEQFEQVLKTDVCKNPEAAKLLDEEPPAASPPPDQAKGK